MKGIFPGFSDSVPRPVLFLDHSPVLGGAEHSLLLILKHLDRRWRVHLACPPGQLAEEAKALGVPVHSFDFPRLRRSPRFFLDWFRGAQKLVRLAREIGAQAFYANTVRAALYAAPAAWLAQLPFIWHMRDFWLSESRPRYPWVDRVGKWLLMRSAAWVITNSFAVARNLPQSKKVSVVHNAIEIERFDPEMDSQAFQAQYQIPADAPVAGMVGRLRPWKGQDRFLRAMARVAEQVPAARFLIVGGEIFGVQDDYERNLHQLADSLGLSDRVVFTGQLEDTRPAHAAMDVFVHPGEPEPFGLVNIEAMGMGKPVVAFEHGALPEIIVDGETGLLVTPGNEIALADAVLELMKNPERRRSMGMAGRKRVEKLFTMKRVAAELDGVLSEVLR